MVPFLEELPFQERASQACRNVTNCYLSHRVGCSKSGRIEVNKDQKRSKAPLGGSIRFWGLEGKGPEIGFGMEGCNLNWTGEVFSSGEMENIFKAGIALS